MVVDDIENDSDSHLVGGIHETLKGVGIAIVMGRRIKAHAVIAPIPQARTFRDRHYFNKGHTETMKFR